jgi:signal transduction histidine kinase
MAYGAPLTHSAISGPLSEALARMLRHEMGNFLQRIYATVALVEVRLPADWKQERECLHQLRERGESCKQILDAVQDFICPVVPNFEICDLATILTEELAAIRKRNPGLVVDFHGDRPAPVNVDRELTAHIASILIRNATESGATHLTVALRVYNKQVELIVADNGPGMPAEMLGSLFNPFFTTKLGHAGLGLALARKFVVLQNGEISADNQQKGGFVTRVLFSSATPN